MARNASSATLLKRKLAEIRAGMPFILDKQDVGEGLVERIRKRFRKGVKPDGSPWAPLSPKYKKTKPAVNRGHILINTGHLIDSIQVIRGRPAGRFASATGAGFRIGIESITYTGRYGRSEDTARYGRFHQQGIGGNKKRPIIGFNEADREFVVDKVRQSLIRLVS